MKLIQDKKQSRPKYNLWQSSAYMIDIAWKYQKSVLILCILLVITEVLLNVVNFLIAPTILQKIELSGSLEELIKTIAAFGIVLMFLMMLKAYISTNTRFGRITVRTHIVGFINDKISTTSYPNTIDTVKLK